MESVLCNVCRNVVPFLEGSYLWFQYTVPNVYYYCYLIWSAGIVTYDNTVNAMKAVTLMRVSESTSV